MRGEACLVFGACERMGVGVVRETSHLRDGGLGYHMVVLVS